MSFKKIKLTFSLIGIIGFNLSGIHSIRLDLSKIDIEDIKQKISSSQSFNSKNSIDIKSEDANGCNCKPESDKKNRNFKSGTVTVGVDNNNQPIKIAYTKKGKRSPKRITLVLGDAYFGMAGWKCIQDELSKYFYTIAFDPLGWGKSSAPEPTALDGIGGEAIGYSYGQRAYFLHEFLAQFNIESPIVYIGVDTQSQPGLIYANRYTTGSLAFSKIIMVNPAFQPIVGDDPCKLSFLNTSLATFFNDAYLANPCEALCLLFGTGTFGEPACPIAGNNLLNEAVNFGATLPKSVWTRTIFTVAKEDVSNLMATTTIPALYIYSVVENSSLLFRQAGGMSFTGFCGACTNSECPATFVSPFPDCQFVTMSAKGTTPYRTDKKRFARLVRDFASGCDKQCCVCKKPMDTPVICPAC